jgi:hypothetical protein
LTRPYTVEAIGNPDTLPGRFLDSAGGQSWLDLQANLALQFTMSPEESLSLAGEPTLATCCRDAEVGSR